MAMEFKTVGWDHFWDAWDHVIKRMPEAKHTALFEAGKAILLEVQQQIVRQGVHDSFGRVQRWQEMRLESGKGYVAISPDAEVVRVSKGGAPTTARTVTNALERGHGVRGPSGRGKRYQPRIRGNGRYVAGRMFYSFAKMNSEQIAIHAAELGLTYWENALDEALNGEWGDE